MPFSNRMIFGADWLFAILAKYLVLVLKFRLFSDNLNRLFPIFVYEMALFGIVHPIKNDRYAIDEPRPLFIAMGAAKLFNRFSSLLVVHAFSPSSSKMRREGGASAISFASIMAIIACSAFAASFASLRVPNSPRSVLFWYKSQLDAGSLACRSTRQEASSKLTTFSIKNSPD